MLAILFRLRIAIFTAIAPFLTPQYLRAGVIIIVPRAGR